MTDNDFDPWTASLEDVAREIYRPGTIARDPGDLSSPDAHHEYVDWLSKVLQARAVVDAAETQMETTKKLVWATWSLAVITAVLASAAVVALFIR